MWSLVLVWLISSSKPRPLHRSVPRPHLGFAIRPTSRILAGKGLSVMVSKQAPLGKVYAWRPSRSTSGGAKVGRLNNLTFYRDAPYSQTNARSYNQQTHDKNTFEEKQNEQRSA